MIGVRVRVRVVRTRDGYPFDVSEGRSISTLLPHAFQDVVIRVGPDQNVRLVPAVQDLEFLVGGQTKLVRAQRVDLSSPRMKWDVCVCEYIV